MEFPLIPLPKLDHFRFVMRLDCPPSQSALDEMSVEAVFLLAQVTCWEAIRRMSELPPEEKRRLGEKYNVIV